MHCLKCDECLEQFADWDYVGHTITCPKCGHVMNVNWDEVYEDGEGFEYFYLEPGPGLIETLFNTGD
jgi:hypothetical protein